MKFTLLSVTVALLLTASSALATTFNSNTVDQKNITYQGGPIITGPVSVYFVFYGNWTKEDSEATHTILMDFTDNISQSEWFNTLQYYTDSDGRSITGPMKSLAGVIDGYSQHQNASSASSDFYLNGRDSHIKVIEDVVANTSHLGDAIDSHGIYLVFTSEDVGMDGFCTEWCGYNSWTDRFLFAVIGHPRRCPDACIPPLNKVVSPNGNIYADAMVNTLAHEFIDLLTDPLGNGYLVSESDKEEVGDFCIAPRATAAEWWGVEGVDLKKTESGAYYNVALGENGQFKYLIQSIWSPKESKCVLGSSKA